nr:MULTISPECIES: TetR family transcriptional regulator [unclassified Bacillus (in: firmicutes)]
MIAEKVTELFSYAKTSVKDITKSSGYRKGHIYYHYQNKVTIRRVLI